MLSFHVVERSIRHTPYLFSHFSIMDIVYELIILAFAGDYRTLLHKRYI